MELSNCFLVSGNAGQGKTTVAKNIAVALRQFGFDVLLVDSDLRSPKIGYHVGMPLAERVVQDALRGLRPLKDCLYCHPSGLKLLLSSLAEVDVPHPSVLLPELRKLADIVIIDVPSFDYKWYDTGCSVLLVTSPDFPSVLDVAKLCSRSNVCGVVVNRSLGDSYDLSSSNISELLSKPIFGVVCEEPSFREALKHGYSIVEFHPEFDASISLKQIAAKLMNLEYSSPMRKPLLAKLGLL